MGYMHIDNLYKNQSILLFRKCYALEKIHGTSAHISWNNGTLSFFSGGEKHEKFLALFDEKDLRDRLNSFGYPEITIFGEAYGGKQQGQSWRYGPTLKFIVFEVKIGHSWLSVLDAENVVTKLNLEFIHYSPISTDIETLNAERDAPSVQAKRNGILEPKSREGIVLRPFIEVKANNGERIIAKHKRDEERETKTPRKITDPTKLQILKEAKAVAEEWVNPTRLSHVLDKIGQNVGIERTRDVINAMIEDIIREGNGELVDSKEARAAIGRLTAYLFKQRIKDLLTY